MIKRYYLQGALTFDTLIWFIHIENYDKIYYFKIGYLRIKHDCI